MSIFSRDKKEAVCAIIWNRPENVFAYYQPYNNLPPDTRIKTELRPGCCVGICIRGEIYQFYQSGSKIDLPSNASSGNTLNFGCFFINTRPLQITYEVENKGYYAFQISIPENEDDVKKFYRNFFGPYREVLTIEEFKGALNASNRIDALFVKALNDPDSKNPQKGDEINLERFRNKFHNLLSEALVQHGIELKEIIDVKIHPKPALQTHPSLKLTLTNYVLVATEKCLLQINPNETPIKFNEFLTDNRAGRYRSVKVLSTESGPYLVIGTEYGVLAGPLSPKPYPNDFTPYTIGELEKRGGSKLAFNSVALVQNQLFATHSNYGLVRWRIDAPSQLDFPLQNVLEGSPMGRGIFNYNNHIFFISGNCVIEWNPLKERAEPVIYNTSISKHASNSISDLEIASQLVAVVVLNEKIYAISLEGSLYQWEFNNPAPIEKTDPFVSSGSKVYSLRVVYLKDSPVFLAGTNMACISTLPLAGTKEIPYIARRDISGFRAVDGRSDYIFAIEQGGRSVYIWHVAQRGAVIHTVSINTEQYGYALDLWMVER